MVTAFKNGIRVSNSISQKLQPPLNSPEHWIKSIVHEDLYCNSIERHNMRDGFPFVVSLHLQVMIGWKIFRFLETNRLFEVSDLK